MPSEASAGFGLLSAESLGALSGLDLLRGMMSGHYPAPPVAQTAGMRIVEATEGCVAFDGEPHARFFNPLGTIHGGWASTLLDTVMACAVHSLLKPGQAYTTAEFKIHFVRPILPTTGMVRAVGTIVHAGARMATSEGRITDGKGRLLAHGTETCMIFEMRTKPA